MSAALGLLRLQQVDIRMGRNESRLQQIQETLDNNSELTAAREALKAAESSLHNAEHARKVAESDAQGQQTKIAQTESSLYGGTVRSPKELQDLQADVVSLKKRLAATEDQELQAMLRVEAAETAVSAAKEDLERMSARIQNEHHKLIDERSVLSREREQLLAERKAAVGAVAAGILAQYDALRQLRRGVAVSEVLENACSACGTTLTAAQQQSARHADQLVFCPACGRILYAG